MGIKETCHYLLNDVAGNKSHITRWYGKTKSRSTYKQIRSTMLILDLLWCDQLCSDISLLMKHCILPHFISLIKWFTLSSFLSNSFSDIFPCGNISFTGEIFSLYWYYFKFETPMMHLILGGATAHLFVTHHNALNMKFYQRTSPELHLKQLVEGGFDRV